MTFSSFPWLPNISYSVISLLAFLGFFISLYIRVKKTRKQPMLCYIGQDCEKVVHSQYSKFFGIPLESMGMIYYAFLALSYASLVLFPTIAVPEYTFTLFVLTFAAVIFSFYLLAIQAFAIKDWCSWCLGSAGVSALIFLASLINLDYEQLIRIAEYKTLFLTIHLIGVTLGVGGATISDIFFFRFLKDFRISKFESEILNTLSQVIWLGLGIVTLTGLAIYLPAAADYNVSAKFLSKMVIVLVIIINGGLLNFYVSPRLINISFGHRHHHEKGELRRFRQIAFASGAVSISSWYFTLILGSIRSIPISVPQMLGVYAATLFIVISISQVIENHLNEEAIERLHSFKEKP